MAVTAGAGYALPWRCTHHTPLLHESLQRSLEQKNKFSLGPRLPLFGGACLVGRGSHAAEQWLRQCLGYQAKSPRITIDDVQRLWVAARLATVKERYTFAATLFGLAESTHSQIHHVIGGPIRALADDALSTVQAELGPTAFAEAFATGQAMTLEGTFATILLQEPSANVPLDR